MCARKCMDVCCVFCVLVWIVNRERPTGIVLMQNFKWPLYGFADPPSSVYLCPLFIRSSTVSSLFYFIFFFFNFAPNGNPNDGCQQIRRGGWHRITRIDASSNKMHRYEYLYVRPFSFASTNCILSVFIIFCNNDFNGYRMVTAIQCGPCRAAVLYEYSILLSFFSSFLSCMTGLHYCICNFVALITNGTPMCVYNACRITNVASTGWKDQIPNRSYSWIESIL